MSNGLLVFAIGAIGILCIYVNTVRPLTNKPDKPPVGKSIEAVDVGCSPN